jgi:hypothetical protein
MPAVIIGGVVADDEDFGFFVLAPVVSGSRSAIARELSRDDDVDEIIGDRPALPIGQEIAFEISATESDQIAERERQPDHAAHARGGERCVGGQTLFNDSHEMREW